MTALTANTALPPEASVTARYRIASACDLFGAHDISANPIKGSLEIHDLILEGIPSECLLTLVEAVPALSTGDVLNKAIGISIRTLQRHKSEPKQRKLSAEQSGRIWRFAEILTQASEVMGSQEAAENWLLQPAIGLDNRRPIDLLGSPAGAEAVGTYLTRLEYGVYT